MTETPHHHTHTPLRSAMKRSTSRPSSPSPSDSFSFFNGSRSASHSPSLLSRIPLPPPGGSNTNTFSLPPTPLPMPQPSLPILQHSATTGMLMSYQDNESDQVLSMSPTSTMEQQTLSALTPSSSALPTSISNFESLSSPQDQTLIPTIGTSTNLLSPPAISAYTSLTSPAPSPSYTPKVSFDTFENPQASMFSFTLQVKSAGYKRQRDTRVYLCAASADESGREALDWCLESLAQDGDEVIVFRGVDEEVLEKDHDIIRDDARELMRIIQEKSVETDPDRKLSLILEYIPGKITDTLDRLIALYRPDSVVVGTRGRRGLMGVAVDMGMGRGVGGFGGIGSVSKYCLSHSPVPVIVVRPERKLKKAVEKRKADPKRGRHFE